MDDKQLPTWLTEATSALDEKMGLEVLEASPTRVVGRAPVEGNTQIMGLWHGGASGVMVETLGSIAANAAAQPDRAAVGVEMNVTHHRPVSKGFVTGTATALRIGGSIASYDVTLSDDQGRLVATGRLTAMFVDARN